MKIFRMLTAVCLIAVLGTVSVSAADVLDRENDVTITFEAGEGPTNPVDPENPDNPDPEIPPVDGSLSIIHVTDFAFDTAGSGHAISNQQESYVVQTVSPNAQVVDLRGNGAGWQLSASLGEFESDVSGQTVTNSLRGAYIKISQVQLATTTGNPSTAPTGHTNITLDQDNTPKPVTTAAERSGMGLWVSRFYAGGQNRVELVVPSGSATVGNHAATITWTLSDAPQ